MKMKGISLKSVKVIEAGQVEECCGQVAHEVYLADGQVEILTFFLVVPPLKAMLYV